MSNMGGLGALDKAMVIAAVNLVVLGSMLFADLWSRPGLLAAAALLYVVSFLVLVAGRLVQPGRVIVGATLATLLVIVLCAGLFEAALSHPNHPAGFAAFSMALLGSLLLRETYALAAPAVGLALVSALGALSGMALHPVVRRSRHAV